MLKRSVVFATIVGLSLTGSQAFAASKGTGSKGASTAAKGYTAKSGKSVSTYRKTTPDSTQKNNYSAKGNVNPTTGKVGTKPPQK